jgi:hypothetical protein
VEKEILLFPHGNAYHDPISEKLKEIPLFRCKTVVSEELGLLLIKDRMVFFHDWTETCTSSECCWELTKMCLSLPIFRHNVPFMLITSNQIIMYKEIKTHKLI